MKLPPLNALKAFEAAARLGSFVLAAEELGVTPTAVSLQVRNLETFFNKKLFSRSNNRIQLTDAGIAIYQEAAEALAKISQFTARLLNDGQRSGLTISILPSLAERWLAPELAEFMRSNPGFSVNIRIEDDPIDFAQQSIDLRITFGDHFYPGYQSSVLFQDEVVPLASPAFLNNIDANDVMMQISDIQFIHVDWGSSFATHLGWGDWFQEAGYARQPTVADGIKVANTSFAIALAKNGAGITLAQRRLVSSEVEQGGLVIPVDISLKLPRSYVAVCTNVHDPYRQKFLQWLRNRLAKQPVTSHNTS